jgi:hypothetical protein
MIGKARCDSKIPLNLRKDDRQTTRCTQIPKENDVHILKHIWQPENQVTELFGSGLSVMDVMFSLPYPMISAIAASFRLAPVTAAT